MIRAGLRPNRAGPTSIREFPHVLRWPDLAGGTSGGQHTVSSYWDAFSPAPPWDALPSWPPDVFAFANLVLDHTEAFRFAVSPPSGRRWPPTPDWNDRVRAAARSWRMSESPSESPEVVRRLWSVVTEHRDVTLPSLRAGEPWELCEALVTLHAMADETCAGLTSAGRSASRGPFEARAWAMLEEHGSLARLPPARVRITPKVHFPSRGITIRSLSRYLSLCYEAVDVRWRRIEPERLRPERSTPRPEYKVLLLPWPLTVRAQDFRPVVGPLDNMDPAVFGFFEFAPQTPFDMANLRSVLDWAMEEASRIDALVLPEDAVTPDEIPGIEKTLEDHGVDFLVAGVRTHATATALARNYVHVGVLTRTGWERYEQDKHHRWCLDREQIAQYHLTRTLDPRKLWWEAISLRPRTLQVIDLGRGRTSVPLVCEDLARMDEVTDLLRRIGPTLIIAILLDGPQLSSRWPFRYSSVLTDEPGSAVLTLTSLGMALRSRPSGSRRSRVVALWNDRSHGLREISLDRGASGVWITIGREDKTVWTADGRRHEEDSPDLALRETHQLRIPARH